MCIGDCEELVDREPSPIAPSGSAGACRGDNEVEFDVMVLLLQKDSVRSVTIKGDLVQRGEAEGRGRHTGLTEG